VTKKEQTHAMQQGNPMSGAYQAFSLAHYYEQIVLLYSRPLTAFATRLTGHVEDAEDIVQDALIRAYYALERYPAERIQTLKVRPWLYKITWNTYCNYTGRSKSPAMLSLDASDDLAPPEPEEREEEQPEQLFESRERRQEIEALVATLPQRYREIITLHYLEELSQQEIAEMLNQPVGTVRVALHRGIKLLRKTLGIHLKGGK
jgi:RNA polymerase sigma-70 factor (ECF subfamily)